MSHHVYLIYYIMSTTHTHSDTHSYTCTHTNTHTHMLLTCHCINQVCQVCLCTKLQVLHQITRLDLRILSMAVQPTKVELRYGILTTGTQCVMIPGVLLMPMLLADNLGTRRQHMPTREPTLAKDLEKSFWTICIVMELNDLFSSVLTMDCIATTAGMVKMQV